LIPNILRRTEERSAHRLKEIQSRGSASPVNGPSESKGNGQI